MVTINLYLRQHCDSDSGIIYVKFHVNREKVHFSTGVKCILKNWNQNKQRIGTGDINSKDKNLILDTIAARCNDVFVKFRLRNRILTKDAFLREYHRPSDYSNFFEFAKAYQKKYSAKIELTTLNTHNSVLNKMKEYNPNLHFDDVTADFLDEYHAHLKFKCANNDNTVMKNMATIKVYVRAAMKAGYMEIIPLRTGRSEEWPPITLRSFAGIIFTVSPSAWKLLNVAPV
ncbi:MAG: phage integrase SAM-like domain and Arm DNA-binding domain-containing protein [Bacteroidales bacterium]